jgi:hypothetical protein
MELIFSFLINVLRIGDLGTMEDDPWLMVQKKGNQFVVDDQPFYVNGFNTYWLMVFAADESTRVKVTDVFKQASSVGLTVCRTWAFNDGQWRALQKSPSVYDEEVFKVLSRIKYLFVSCVIKILFFVFSVFVFYIYIHMCYAKRRRW